MNIVVIGLGKIGLPLAAQFALSGHNVVGADVNAAVVDSVNAGIEPFPGEHQLADILAGLRSSGHLTATTDTTAAVSKADAVVVVVPLFVNADGIPDFGWMDSATADLAAGLRPGTLVLYETTLPVGTTRGRWKPMLEQGSGLTEGVDFDLVFSPERVLTGRVFTDLKRYPKLIGGLSKRGAQRAKQFYEAVLTFDPREDLPRPNGVWDLGSAEAAEMAKLAETTYRDVNIGLANQFARFAHAQDIDITAVIDACNSQPYSHIHRPGIAVGGHCIPVYPRLYLWNDPDASVVAAARQANGQMPSYAVGLATAAYGDLSGCRALILGAAYRGGVKETAFSGVFPLADALCTAGATVTVHDPWFTDDELTSLGLTPQGLGQPVDVVFLQADHQEFATLTYKDIPGARVLVDGRGVVDPAAVQPTRVISIG